MSLERKLESYEPEQDSVLQGFLSFVAIPLEQYAKVFLESGKPEDYLLFIRRLEASGQEEKNNLQSLVREIEPRNDILSSQEYVLLGHAFENAIDDEKDEKQAAIYFEQGGEIGCFALARMLLIKQDRANQWNNLAWRYEHLHEVALDLKLAAEFKDKASREGERLVEKSLKLLSKIPHDSKLIGETWFLRLHAYSKMEEHPDGILQQCWDEAKAHGCLRVHDVVIKNNSKSAGTDVLQYKPELITLLENATKAGFVKACFDLATVEYSRGRTKEWVRSTLDLKCCSSLIPEYVRRRTFFEVLANLGNVNALRELAGCIVLGEGIAKDKFKARITYRLVAEKSLMQRETRPAFDMGCVEASLSPFERWFPETKVRSKITSAKDADIEDLYHSLLGLHTCQLWRKKKQEAKKTAEYFEFFVSQHEDAVLALIQPDDIPSLRRILSADTAAKLEAKHQIRFASTKGEFREGCNVLPNDLENLILGYAGIPSSFFGKAKKSVSKTTIDAMNQITEPALKKRRLT